MDARHHNNINSSCVVAAAAAAAAVALALALAAAPAAYATHVSRPVMAELEKQEYVPGETVAIRGWAEYQQAGAPDVLLDISVAFPDATTVNDQVRSDANGNFTLLLPLPQSAPPGTYTVDVVSQCRDEHRDICTHQSSSFQFAVVASADQTTPDEGNGGSSVAAGGNEPRDEEENEDEMESRPIELRAPVGDMEVLIDWTPGEAGEENRFDIRFEDAQGREVTGVTYDISLTKDGATVEGTERTGQAPGVQSYVLDELGQYELVIANVGSSQGGGQAAAAAAATIPITITPEFPPFTAPALAAAAVAMAVALARRHRASLQGRRRPATT